MVEKAVYISDVYSWFKIDEKKVDEKGIEKVNEKSVADWIKEHPNGYLIFGSDVVPDTVFDPQNIIQSPIYQFMKNGGKAVWAADIPFFYINRNGKKVESSYHFIPYERSGVLAGLSSEILPKPENVKLTLIGELLNYPVNESWRPIIIDRQEYFPIIPIAVTSDLKISSWILKIGKGFLIRLFDMPGADEEYLLSFPEKFEELKNKKILRLNNVRRFEKQDWQLDKVNVLIGDNSTGKTTVLESVATLSNPALDDKFFSIIHEIIIAQLARNRGIIVDKDQDIKTSKNESQLIKNLRLTLGKSYGLNFSMELLLENYQYFGYLSSEVREINLATDYLQILYIDRDILRDYYDSILLAYTDSKLVFDTLIRPRLRSKELIERIRGKIIDDYFTAVISPFGAKATENKNDIFIITSTGDQIRLMDFGEGTKSLFILTLLFELVKPKIALIDDIESLAVFTGRFEELTNLLKGIADVVIITTQSIEVISYLADFKAKFFVHGREGVKELSYDDVLTMLNSGLDPRRYKELIEYLEGVK